MKKLFLALLVPFFMVMTMSAYTIPEMETDYQGDEVELQVREGENGGFRVFILNASGDDVLINYDESYYCPVESDGTPLAQPEGFFTADEINADAYVIPAGNFWATEEWTLQSGVTAIFSFQLYIYGEPTTWDIAVAN